MKMMSFKLTSGGFGILLLLVGLFPMSCVGGPFALSRDSSPITDQQCFTCRNAKTHEECNVRLETCLPTQKSCQTEVRVDNTNSKFEVRISKGCKQTRACLNNEMQNDRPAWPITQCSLDPSTLLSVCRTCCNTVACNGEMQERSCKAIEAPQNGQISCDKDGRVGSEVCSFKCNKCFKLVGSEKRICMQDNLWSGLSAKCVPDGSCVRCDESMTSPPDNGDVECSSGAEVQSTCSFTCTEGYSLTGEKDVLCLDRVRGWNAKKPQCLKIDEPSVTCERLELEHGTVFCDADNISTGTICRFSCDNCYTGTGIETAICQEDGTWSENAFTCQPDESCNRCDDSMSSAPSNGDVVCSNGAQVGSVCVFSCAQGHDLIGEDEVECLPFIQQWSFEKPRCRQSRDTEPSRCNRLQLEHGTVACEPDERSIGSTCRFTCDSCYKGTGMETTICQEDETWSAHSFSCQQDLTSEDNCPELECTDQSMLLSIVDGETDCDNGARFGSTCRFTCNDGYELSGSDFTTCQLSNREWSHQRPECQLLSAVTCDELPALENGSTICHPDATSLGSVCVFSCVPCNRMTNSPSRMCTDGMWTGVHPECVYDPIFDRCPDEFCPADMTSPIQHGVVQCTDTDRRGSMCAFSCDLGFTLSGEEQIRCTSGGWTSDKPTCVEGCHPLAIASTDMPGHCVCVRGYKGDGYSCDDINECANSSTNGCHDHATCTNTHGSYVCECLDGFEGDGFTCTDVNECLNPDDDEYRCHRPHGICFNQIGGYNCTCKPGYNGDGLTCIKNEAQCPPSNLLDDDYCFRYIVTNVTDPSYTASDACTNIESGHPALIRTKEQYDTLTAILASILIPDNDVVTRILGPWIGLHDRYQPGIFRWRDGARLSDDNHQVWANGYPQLSSGEPRCVHLVSDPLQNNGSRDFFWEDRRCTDEARYVCNTEKTYEPTEICQPGLSEIDSNISCTDGWNAGSTCKFTCNQGYTLVGPSDSVTCVAPMMRWNNLIPQCIEAACAPQVTPPNGGSVVCSRGNKVGSTCDFQCHDGYIMAGTETITCQPDLTWTARKPCCVHECPPKARMNIIFIVDSSGSIGEENFFKIKQFVKSMYSEFHISTHYTQVSVLAFHSVVELANNTDWFDNKQDLDLAFDSVNFAGKGTMTGKALQYAADHLTNVREGASTVVVIVTDGNARDNARLGSAHLRQKGVHVFAVGVTGSNYRDLSIIASRPSQDNVYSLVQDTDLVTEIGERVCNVQC